VHERLGPDVPGGDPISSKTHADTPVTSSKTVADVCT
jgi:hypothetical protein